jgi:hypothetical protein
MGDASKAALDELGELLQAVSADADDERWAFADDRERAMYRHFAMESLHHTLLFWLQADPQRPRFVEWIRPYRKLLGDNPDSLYYGTVLDPTRRYRIRGNTMHACYTSFTIERGTAGGKMSQQLGTTLNDTEFDIDAAGNYELIAGPDATGPNSLRLDPDAGSITTRHYFEWERSVGLDPATHIPLVIEPLDDAGPPPVPDDAATAAGIRRVISFLRTLTVDAAPAPRPSVPWSTCEPNTFTNPPPDEGNRAIGYAAADNVYRRGQWDLGPDEALVITGRFPRCRFANVVLWNRHMQTLPYDRRRVSLNRVQTQYEADGSFRMVVAHADPGVPNWLDTCGLRRGVVFWRFLLPAEPLTPLETKVVPLRSLR